MGRILLLELLRFRSWPKLSLPLAEGQTAITGPNGSGKTNILEALALFSPGRGLRNASAEALPHQHDPLGWRLRAELHGGEMLETSAQGGESRRVRINEAVCPQLALTDHLTILWLTPAMDRLWSDSPETRRRFLDRMTLALLPGHGAEVLAYEKAMRERNRLFREGRREASWFSALEHRMAEHGARMTVARRSTIDQILMAQQQHHTAFPAAELSLIEAGDVVPTTDAGEIKERLAASRSRDAEAGRALVGPHRADLQAVYQAKSMPAALCSTGEQKALLIALILANARVRTAQGGVPLLLLDEVAAHLDAARRAQLFEEVQSLGAQAVMTGTGSELFADMPTGAARIEVAETGGISRISYGSGAP